MFDFARVHQRDIADKVRKEAAAFQGCFHFGVQGLVKTLADTEGWIRKLKATGMPIFAFDTEMIYVSEVERMLDGFCPIHAAVSYPMGRMLVDKKMRDLGRLAAMGVRDVCVCLDWQKIFSGEYRAVEAEATAIMKEFSAAFVKNALVIPATLLGDSQLLAVGRALDAAGVVSIKMNPGAQLGVSFEEVAFINRNFPNRFDIHPSGNIRSLAEVERYFELGCRVIHTASALEITDHFIERQLRKYGGTWS